MLLPRVSTDRQDDGSRHYLIAAGTASYDYRPFDDQLMSVKRDRNYSGGRAAVSVCPLGAEVVRPASSAEVGHDDLTEPGAVDL